MSERRKTAGEEIWERASHRAFGDTEVSETSNRWAFGHLRTLIIIAIDELVEDLTRDHDAEIEAMEKHYNRLD